ncbi:hypothetical protein H310_00374 [Aphanomyces invadans]|uniref:Uncharacterized protein n=1 Tax=Aphanomyces invadans TaxID=157072 RepID=A0A024UWE5_9STRA|nr:hypothetical protein H310_00374 [Aphanomyces invadans]ETW09953.1 hypothetical protein H310_00374 [Aphanomyces invadans]|eukprot:XP_008861364.1 hypothetical protein H310_00374 [Aphanomyces invadans]
MGTEGAARAAFDENLHLQARVDAQEMEIEELLMEQTRLKRKEMRALYRQRMVSRHPAVVLEEPPTTDETFDFDRREMQIILMEDAYDAMLRMVDSAMNDVSEDDVDLVDEYHDLYRFHRQWHPHPNSDTPIKVQNVSMLDEPWKSLLDAYANGNPNKFKYLSSWIRYMLLGGTVGPTATAQFPAGVELSFLSREVIEGFSRILVPALQEHRPDLNVHVFSKTVVDCTLRIVVMPKNRSKGKDMSSEHHAVRPPRDRQ